MATAASSSISRAQTRRSAPSALPFPEAVPLATHFRVEAKMGIRPVLRCAHCGAGTPFSPARGANHTPSRELRQFVEQHTECRHDGENVDAPENDCTQAE